MANSGFYTKPITNILPKFIKAEFHPLRDVVPVLLHVQPTLIH